MKNLGIVDVSLFALRNRVGQLLTTSLALWSGIQGYTRKSIRMVVKLYSCEVNVISLNLNIERLFAYNKSIKVQDGALMANKLTGNGLWESSRMMLPEHKVRINQLAEDQKKRVRIYLDEQEWDDVSRIVAQSLEKRVPIRIKMFHEFEEIEVNGIVDRVDQLQGRFMVDGEWCNIRDIEGAQLDD
jgi:hypothetical protein